tara:strand:- start:1806 stop:2132 length:327 start_codon:yes stop_codon:yes gene_type:complete
MLQSGGLLGSFLALIGASCCVVPVILVHLGVATGLVAKLNWLARIQPFLLGVSALILIVAAILAVRGGRASWTFWIWWGLGAAFLALAVALPQFEFQLQRLALDWTRG